MLRRNILLVRFVRQVVNQKEEETLTEPSYHPRETGRPPKEEGSMDVWTGILVIAWFITIVFGIQISWAAMSFNIDVLAQLSPYLLASILITILWIAKKTRMDNKGT
jgi:hypothetical protein